MPLAAGKYPQYDEEWLLDGQPTQPYRRTLKTRYDINTNFTLVTATMYIFAVPVQAGDVFSYAGFGVKTQATATSSHAWVAVYNGVKTGAALLAQTADVAAGWATGGQHLALGSAIADSPTVGTPQGPSTAAVVASGPAVWGMVFYNSTSGTGNILDACTLGNVTGEQIVSTQISLSGTASLSATATAPATLPTVTATAQSIVYGFLANA